MGALQPIWVDLRPRGVGLDKSILEPRLVTKQQMKPTGWSRLKGCSRQGFLGSEDGLERLDTAMLSVDIKGVEASLLAASQRKRGFPLTHGCPMDDDGSQNTQAFTSIALSLSGLSDVHQR